MTSRERIRAAIAHQETDRLPCCFEGICHGLTRFVHDRYADPLDQARFYLDLGLDTAVMLSPPQISTTGIRITETRREIPGERYPVLRKEYETAAGVLVQEVNQTADYGASIRLLGDHNVPRSRSRSYLVSGESDLPALRHVMTAPRSAELDTYRSRARQYREFCAAEGVLFSAGLEGVGDPLIWLSGVEQILIWAMEEPRFLDAFVGVISAWSLRRLQIMLDEGVEHIVRRGWYESADLWSPQLYERFLLDPLSAEVRLAHEAGATVTYVMNSGAGPLLDFFPKIGIDIYSNIDPLAPQTDLTRIKRTVGDRMCLCGGVNNNHVLERGSAKEVRAAVERAVDTLAPGGGFILAPGDSVLDTGETAQQNFRHMVQAWREVNGDASAAMSL